MCRIDPERKCPNCEGRMYLDNFSDTFEKQGERWVCMDKENCGKTIKIKT